MQKTVFFEKGCMTTEVDLRGGVFDDHGRILLIRDRSDERSTLPGGWCDVSAPPSLAVEREVEEESEMVRASRIVRCARDPVANYGVGVLRLDWITAIAVASNANDVRCQARISGASVIYSPEGSGCRSASHSPAAGYRP